ncbi:MAG: TonB-dependent receptor [Arcobacter sp.]|nr:TonB-dependent receptor [Arcobacter sp.]
MKKNIILSSIVALSLLSSANAKQDLGEVIVTTATKTKKNIEGVTASVIVVSQKDIQKMGAESLKDVISKTSGLTVQYGTFPSASAKSKSSISIRGMSANGTLFLLDGRRLAGEVKNPFDLDRIPASSIEKIEIVKGPMSSLYGADATGGIINIITKKATEHPSINLGLRYGQNGDGDAKNKNISFSARGKVSKFSYSVYANKTNTTPYTQKENANVMVKAPKTLNPMTKQKTFQKTKPSQLSVPTLANGKPLPVNPKTQGLLKGVKYLKTKLQDRYLNEDVTYREESNIITAGGRFDYNFSDELKLGFDINAFDEDREGQYIGYFHPSKFKMPVFNIPVNSKDENKRIDLGLDLESSLSDDLMLKFRVYKSYYKKRNTTTAKYYKELGFPSEKASASNGMNANVDIISYEAMVNYALNSSHFLTAGAEYRDENREATVFDNTPDMDTREVDYKSIYLQDEWQINDTLNATLGARYDKVSNADNKATFRLGLVNSFSNMANLRAIFAQGYRTPDIRELYINKQTPNGLQQGATVIGYDLKPEFTNTYEIGLGGRNEKLSYDIAVFLNDIKNRISQIKKDKYYTFENISKAQTKGIELNVSYALLDNFLTSVNFTELRTEDKKTGDDLDFNPKRTAMLSLSYEANDKFTFSPSLKYIGEQSYKQKGKVLKADSQTLVDLNLNYDIHKNINIYAGANNIFDEKVDDILGSNVGRYYFAGLRIGF